MATEILGGDLKIIADLAIKSVQPMLLPLRAFAKTAEIRDSVSIGDTVQVFVGGAIPDATEFDAANNHYETDNGGSHAYKPVTLSKHPKSTFVLTMSQLNKLDVKSLADMVASHAKIVSKKVSTDLFALVTKTNFAGNVIVGTEDNFDASDVNQLETKLAAAVGLGDDRYLINNMAYFKALRDDTTLASNIYTGTSDVVRAGVIPGVYGFREVLRTGLLPTSPNNLVGVVTDTTGLLFAQAIENPITAAEKAGLSMDGLHFEVGADLETSIQLCFSAHFNPNARRVYITCETWTGNAVGRPEGLFRVLNAADA